MILFIYNSYIGSGLVSEDISKFVVRIPANLHERIKILADRDNRSMNNYIIKVLEEHVSMEHIRIAHDTLGTPAYELSADTVKMIIKDIQADYIKNSSDK
jgi:predicted DNA-binding protein